MTQIFLVEQLAQLALDRRAVVSPKCGLCLKPRPAAFLMNLPARVVCNMLVEGLFVYEKPQKAKKEPTHGRNASIGNN